MLIQPFILSISNFSEACLFVLLGFIILIDFKSYLKYRTFLFLHSLNLVSWIIIHKQANSSNEKKIISPCDFGVCQMQVTDCGL